MRQVLAQSALMVLALLVGCSTHAQAKPEEPKKPAQTSPEAVALLQEIEKATAGLKSLKARVKYSRIQSLTGDEQVRFGNFYYQSQQKDKATQFAVLFDRLIVDNGSGKKTARPMQTWYIFDGNWLLERDHDAKQATRRELVPKGAERNNELSLGDGRLPIPLKLEAAKVLKDYHVTLPKLAESDPKLHHLVLTPHKASDDDAPLELWFQKESLQLYRVQTEIDGDTVVLSLPTPEPNYEIKPGVFKTTLPSKTDGWQVQEVPIKR